MALKVSGSRNFPEEEPRHLRVATAFPVGDSSIGETLSGIHEYARQFPCFDFRYAASSSPRGIRELKDWGGDGAIVSLSDEESVKLAEDLPFPVVNISSAFEKSSHPRVRRDHFEVGRKAAEFLLGKGLQEFACVGFSDRWYSQLKFAGYQGFLKSKGFHSEFVQISRFRSLQGEEESLQVFKDCLSKLEMPLGLLIDADTLYGLLREACSQLKLQIPDDIAVISVNNNQTTANAYSPSLSSMEFSNPELGFVAMEILHKCIRDGICGIETDRVVSGLRLYERESTDTIHVKNPKLKIAINYIRANLERPFSTEEVLEQADCSRRWLECAFKDELLISPAKFIQNLRLQRIKHFLVEDRVIAEDEMARLAGFSSKRHLQQVFLKAVGCTMEEFRRKRTSYSAS